MRRPSTGLALALLLACSESSSRPAAAPLVAPLVAPAAESATDAGRPSPKAPSALEACVDRWLAAHGLNEFGDAPGTVYAGGTPLFDESTGATRDRLDYVFARQPQARADCLEAAADAGAALPATGQ